MGKVQTTGPRERLIDSAITLMRQRGVAATGLADLLEHSSTARQSIYQHFPGGKGQLLTEATRVAGQRTESLIEACTATLSPAEWVHALVDMWQEALESTDYRDCCPMLAAALADPDIPDLQAIVRAVFGNVRDRIGQALVRHGVPAEQVDSLSSFLLSCLEGAIIQDRVGRTTEALEHARTHLTELLARHVPNVAAG
ncbi:TetR family transcriptional regulator [Tamaricihabitans halophyticus]|uniref:TetR family transcriptional regulator n=1 Tax=Tamaricihabitans halophyticus TaxID=1262583 RepID=A0A4R2QV14_9PSEU|nr:TetR/AcrR family transcriptional regulator [Tamaricihabitans halophyticus]TCP53567.1 TetR family transcriptional regulator [Tamaricihabitans halophyticus]